MKTLLLLGNDPVMNGTYFWLIEFSLYLIDRKIIRDVDIYAGAYQRNYMLQRYNFDFNKMSSTNYDIIITDMSKVHLLYELELTTDKLFLYFSNADERYIKYNTVFFYDGRFYKPKNKNLYSEVINCKLGLYTRHWIHKVTDRLRGIVQTSKNQPDATCIKQKYKLPLLSEIKENAFLPFNIDYMVYAKIVDFHPRLPLELTFLNKKVIIHHTNNIIKLYEGDKIWQYFGIEI